MSSDKLLGPDGATYGSKAAQGWISRATSWDGNLSLGTHSKCDSSFWKELQGRCGKLHPGERSTGT